MPEDMGKASVPQSSEHRVDVGSEKGYSTISILAKLFLSVIMKLWATCTTVLLILLLIYWFYGGWASLSLLIVAVVGFLYNAQDMLLYYPDQPANSRLYVESPALYGLPFENFFIKASDGTKLHMMLIKQPENKLASAHTVIFLHGNAGNIGHRLRNMYAMYTYCGVNILLLEYRGYGKSHGKPTESGLSIDAQAAADFLFKRKDIDQSKIVVFGRSLGGGVAIQLCLLPYYASRISCLFIENTFTSLPEISRQLFDFKLIKYLPEWCHKNKYPSSARITHIKLPTLFLSGMVDDLIPPRMMLHLFQQSGSLLKRLAKFPEGGHNETWQCSGYYDAINRFFQELEEMKTSDLTPNSAATYTIDVPFDDMAAASTANGVFTL